MITKDQIKLSDGHAGVTASGSPVIYILSKGGLHMFLTKNGEQVEALAAAPHIGIARFFAEKKAGGIDWSPDYIMKSESLEKAKLYHGTNTVFDKFKLPNKKESASLNYGKALYFTDDPEVANEYAKPDLIATHAQADNELLRDPEYQAQADVIAQKHGMRDRDDVRHKKFDDFHKESKTLREKMLIGKLGLKPHVRIQDVNFKNPFDVHNVEHAKKVSEVAGHPGTFDDDIWVDPENPTSTDFYNVLADGETLGWNENNRNSDWWKDKPHKNWGEKAAHVNKLLQQAGFDGIVNKVHKHYAAFKPNQVRDYKFNKSELIKSFDENPKFFQHPKTQEFLHGEIQNMNSEIKDSAQGQRSGFQDDSGSNINTSSKSTFPAYYSKMGVKNKAHFEQVMNSKKGPVYQRMAEHAHDRLANGYSNDHGYGYPDTKYLAHAVQNGAIPLAEYKEKMKAIDSYASAMGKSDFLSIRKSFFNREIMAEDETYAIYNHKEKLIDIMDREDFESTLKKGDITPFSFVRRIDIESTPKIIGT